MLLACSSVSFPSTSHPCPIRKILFVSGAIGPLCSHGQIYFCHNFGSIYTFFARFCYPLSTRHGHGCHSEFGATVVGILQSQLTLSSSGTILFFLFLMMGWGLSSSWLKVLVLGSNSTPGTVASAMSWASNSRRTSSFCFLSS